MAAYIGIIGTICGILGFIIGNLIKPLISKVRQEQDWKRQQDEADKTLGEKIDNIHKQLKSLNLRMRNVEDSLYPIRDSYVTTAREDLLKLYRFEIKYLCEKFNEEFKKIESGERTNKFSIDDIGEFHNLYDTYKRLGGNGKVEAIYEAVEEKLKKFL